MPPPGRLARAGGARESGPLRRRGVLGPAPPRLRRSGRAGTADRAGTGRVFTGDRSGDFLWSALYATGFADRASSRRADDGLTLAGAYIAAAVRCAPPLNRPTNEERDACAPFLARELALLEGVRVIVPLGGFGWHAALRATATLGIEVPRPRPRFGHGAEAAAGPYRLVGSYHPSQQNTFTGRLTPAMFEAILRRARQLAGESRAG